jgi:hypothetical protein
MLELTASLTIQNSETLPYSKQLQKVNDKIESDVKYYEALSQMTKGSKSELGVKKAKSLGKASLDSHLQSYLSKDGHDLREIVNMGKVGAGSTASARGESRYLANALMGFENCITSMPRLMYVAFEAASFCRVYVYSCNNLWPEELNTEVSQGTFCFIHAYETSVPEKDWQYHTIAQTVIEPFYSFLMDFFKYTTNKTFVDNKKSLLESESMAPHPTSHQLQCLEGLAEIRVKCMMQNMRKMYKAGETNSDLSRITSSQMLQLLDRAQNVTYNLAIVEEARRLLTKSDVSLKLEPVPGPLKTSLGRSDYKFSWPQGFVGPVSPNLRFPWDAVQPGLVMTKFVLSTIDPRAVCNDGSPAMMYVKEQSMTKWHFHVDGGFFCFDEETCMERAHQSTSLVSTMGFEDAKNNSGMFDPELGGFPEYTHATVFYCSSDAWMGQVEMEDFQMVGGTMLSNGKPGTIFHGYFILEAVLKALIDMGMGATTGQELWVSGCSAGAIAATAMADSWASRLKVLGMKNEVQIWTMLDNMPIVSPTAVAGPFGGKSIHDMAMALAGFLYGETRGASPAVFLNKDCEAIEGVLECVWPGTVVRYIKIPNIILNQLWDNFVTAKTYGFMHPVNGVQYNTGLYVVDMTKESFKSVTSTQNYWAISCGDHCMSENPNFWRQIPNTGNEKISARDMALQTRDAALGKPGSPPLGRVIMDACNHYNCGCIGSTASMTNLAYDALFYEVLQRLAPGLSPLNYAPMTIPLTTAIASNQLNGFQILTP